MKRTQSFRQISIHILLALPVPIALLLVWKLGVAGHWVLPFNIKMSYVPSPRSVLTQLIDICFGAPDALTKYSGSLLKEANASLIRVFSGFGLAAVIGVPLGVLMGRSHTANALLEPTLNMIRPIPVTAWAPLSVLMIGIGDRSTMFLVFLAAFFPTVLNTITAVAQVPERLLEASAMLGTSPAKSLYKVVLPAALPGIISGLRVAMGLSWALVVVGEMTGITVGLGAMITEARNLNQNSLVVAGMLIIGVLGFLSDRILVWIVKLLAGHRPVLPQTK